MSVDTPAGVPADALSESDEKTWVALSHFGGIFSFIGPLIVWLVYRERSARVGREAKEALNFQLTVALVATALYILGSVLALVVVGLVFIAIAPLVQIFGVVMAIVAGVKVGSSGTFRYPVTIRFIR